MWDIWWSVGVQHMYQWAYGRGPLCWTRARWRMGWIDERFGIQLGCGRIVLETDTSDCGTVSTLIFMRLLYLLSCSKWLFLLLVACYVCVFCLVAFFDRGTAFRQPQWVCTKLYFAAVSASRQSTVSEVAGSVRSDWFWLERNTYNHRELFMTEFIEWQYQVIETL